jgi:hypothetical protein
MPYPPLPLRLFGVDLETPSYHETAETGDHQTDGQSRVRREAWVAMG